MKILNNNLRNHIFNSAFLGVSANVANWRFFVQLVLHHADGFIELICGGTILSSDWIISAAHCCEGQDYLVAKYGQKLTNISHIIMHPERLSTMKFS